MGTLQRYLVSLSLAVGVLLVGCASRGPGASGAAEPANAAGGPPKRITVLMNGDPPTLKPQINRASLAFSVPGDAELENLVHTGLAVVDADGNLSPRLAEAAPTTTNGLWHVFPDGRMETRWALRPNALWQDGAPFTAEDLVFTSRVERDPELSMFRHIGYDSIDTVEAPDARTFIVRWKRPYVEADRMFGSPLPRHLLEQAYGEDKGRFLQLPYWAEEYVGAGPYRPREFVRGSHLLLQANDLYVLGPPKIHEIEVKFIPDTNTMVANVLARAAEMTLGRSLTMEQALQVREQSWDGRLDIEFSNWIVMYPQMLTPRPAMVGDARFRRALMHALDRQQMADALQGGLVPVAHSFISPTAPEYRAIERRIVQYDYDPRKAAQTLEGLGYARGADGVFRESPQAGGQPLSLEIRVTARNPLSNKALLSVADNWQSVGLRIEPVVIPTQRVSDQEYLHTYPSFMFYRQGNSFTALKNHHSSRAPIPENGFVGNNYARYLNPEFDALVDRVFATIPLDERMNVLGDIVHHISDQLNLMGLFYDGTSVLIGSRLQNVTGRSQGWNAHLWEAQS